MNYSCQGVLRMLYPEPLPAPLGVEKVAEPRDSDFVRITMPGAIHGKAVCKDAMVPISDDEIRNGLRDGSLLPEGCENITAHAIRLWRQGRGW